MLRVFIASLMVCLCVMKPVKACFHYGCAARCDRYRNADCVSILTIVHYRSLSQRSAAVVEIVVIRIQILGTTSCSVFYATAFLYDSYFAINIRCYFSCLRPTSCGRRHTVFVLFVRACVVRPSRNIVNTVSCRVFDTFSPDLHQRWTEMNASQFGVKRSKVKVTVE